MSHPVIQAIYNMRTEYNARLARFGQTAVLEILQPLLRSSGPIAGVQWTQRVGTDGKFVSYHGSAKVLVNSKVKGGLSDLGTLAPGWTNQDNLMPVTKAAYNQYTRMFNGIPNDVMCLTFGPNCTVTIDHKGTVTVEEL